MVKGSKPLSGAMTLKPVVSTYWGIPSRRKIDDFSPAKLCERMEVVPKQKKNP